MGYLLIHWEPVYPRAQSQGYVVPPIAMHIPPLLHWLLTVTWEPVYARAQSIGGTAYSCDCALEYTGSQCNSK
jgi:hypothetical protein